MSQIRSQPVGKVHHRSDGPLLSEPSAFAHVRFRVEMSRDKLRSGPAFPKIGQPLSRIAQRTRDENPVSGTSRSAAFDLAVGHAPDSRHANRELPRRSGRVSSEQRNEKLGRQAAIAVQKPLDPFDRRVRRQGDRKKRSRRSGPHGRYIAQIYGKGFASQTIGIGRAQAEMHLFDQHVGRHDQRRAVAAGHHRAVVPDTLVPGGGNRSEFSPNSFSCMGPYFQMVNLSQKYANYSIR